MLDGNALVLTFGDVVGKRMYNLVVSRRVALLVGARVEALVPAIRDKIRSVIRVANVKPQGAVSMDL